MTGPLMHYLYRPLPPGSELSSAADLPRIACGSYAESHSNKRNFTEIIDEVNCPRCAHRIPGLPEKAITEIKDRDRVRRGKEPTKKGLFHGL